MREDYKVYRNEVEELRNSEDEHINRHQQMANQIQKLEYQLAMSKKQSNNNGNMNTGVSTSNTPNNFGL